MNPADRDPIDRFDAALEALSRGQATPFDPADPDADVMATVRRLRAMDAAQHAPAGLADQIWAELMNQRGLSGAPTLDPAGHAKHSLNGKAAPQPWRAANLEPRQLVPHRWTMAQLATAALILLTLAGSVIAVRYVTTERSTAYLEAADKAKVETLVDATVEGAAAKLLPLSIERWTFAPGPATLTVPPLDGPQWIVADGGTLVAIVAGDEHDLTPGTSLVVPAGQDLVLSNPGPGETSALRGVAAAEFALEEYDATAISKQAALDTQGSEVLPPGASHVLFERLSLQPGAVLRIEPATGQDWVGIVSGQLGLTLVGDGLPRNWQSGREREVAATELMPRLDPGTRVSLRNIGDDPLVLLRLRVTPRAEGA